MLIKDYERQIIKNKESKFGWEEILGPWPWDLRHKEVVDRRTVWPRGLRLTFWSPSFLREEGQNTGRGRHSGVVKKWNRRRQIKNVRVSVRVNGGIFIVVVERSRGSHRKDSEDSESIRPREKVWGLYGLGRSVKVIGIRKGSKKVGISIVDWES